MKRTHYTADETAGNFEDTGHDNLFEACINGTTYTLGWDRQDPQNTGWYLSWRKGDSEDGAQIDGDIDNPNWQQVADFINR